MYSIMIEYFNFTLFHKTNEELIVGEGREEGIEINYILRLDDYLFDLFNQFFFEAVTKVFLEESTLIEHS